MSLLKIIKKWQVLLVDDDRVDLSEIENIRNVVRFQSALSVMFSHIDFTSTGYLNFFVS